MQNHVIEIGSYTLTNANILSDVKVEATINPSTDLVLGGISCRELSFSFYKDMVSEEAVSLLTQGEFFTYSFNTTKICQFKAYEIEETNTTIKVNAYDSMCRFDVNVDDWLNTITFPTSAMNLIQKLCSYCGVSYYNLDTSLASGLTIYDNITSTDLTGRQVLSWLAQIIGCYGYINGNNQLVLEKFGSDSGMSLTKKDYNKATISKYTTAVIDRFQIRQAEDDIGVVAGTGTNTMAIQDNPFLYTDSDTELRTYAEGMLAYVSQFTYVPLKVTSYNPIGECLGKYFTVDGHRAIAMSYSQSASGFTLECTGNQLRDIQSDDVNMKLNALRGKTNELIRTVEETTSRLTSVEKDMDTVTTEMSEVKQTAEGITSTVSQVQQDMSNLESETDNKLSEMSSQISQTSESITTTVSKIQSDMSTLESDTDKKLQEMSTTISQTSETITSQVNGINGEVNTIKQSLDGVVYESSLADGTTTINGGCIKTGTIDADRINMTGAITWNDLSSGVQDEIENAGGLSKSQVKTLITDTLVSSPNIQGANYWSEDENTHMDLLDASSVSSGIGGGIVVTGGSTPIFKAYRSALLNVTLSSYGEDFLKITSTGTIHPIGDWNFSLANVTGLDGVGGGEVTVKAVWGA